MINFNVLNLQRLVIHTINPKLSSQEHATVEFSPDTPEITPIISSTLKRRLIDAAGKNSKAFELEIEKFGNGSFFQLVHNLKEKSAAEFLKISREIAELLADSQTSTSIPGGYILIMDCVDPNTNLAVYIVIKAEPHSALQFSTLSGHSKVNLLEKVFLSPSQKLYKIGIVFQKTTISSENVNEMYGCFLFDDQFRQNSHPAEYFYKDFLGFTVSKNAKIQSQKFYQKTENFIRNNIVDTERKVGLLSVLKTSFTVNNDPTINPRDFGESSFSHDRAIKDKYIAEVCNELPHSIVKDSTLIKLTLFNRKINFPDEIKIAGPETGFDEKVTIINSIDEYRSLDVNSSIYTIVKILGKPYSPNE